MVYLFRTQLLALKAWCLPPEYHRRILDKWRGICQASWTVEINKQWIWLETFCQQIKMVQLWVKEFISQKLKSWHHSARQMSVKRENKFVLSLLKTGHWTKQIENYFLDLLKIYNFANLQVCCSVCIGTKITTQNARCDNIIIKI